MESEDAHQIEILDTGLVFPLSSMHPLSYTNYVPSCYQRQPVNACQALSVVNVTDSALNEHGPLCLGPYETE